MLILQLFILHVLFFRKIGEFSYSMCTIDIMILSLCGWLSCALETNAICRIAGNGECNLSYLFHRWRDFPCKTYQIWVETADEFIPRRRPIFAGLIRSEWDIENSMSHRRYLVRLSKDFTGFRWYKSYSLIYLQNWKLDSW